MKTYSVTFERDETGWWVASVLDVPGCHTQGKTIEQTRRRIREALGLFIDNAEKVKLVDDIRLPKDIGQLLTKYQQAKEEAEQKQTEAKELTLAAAKKLTESMNLSVRDTGNLLGLSYQRVQQLVQKN